MIHTINSRKALKQKQLGLTKWRIVETQQGNQLLTSVEEHKQANSGFPWLEQPILRAGHFSVGLFSNSVSQKQKPEYSEYKTALPDMSSWK